MKFYFPEEATEDVELQVLMKKILLLRLDQIARGADNKAEIKKANKRILDLNIVKVYSDFERENEVSFEQGCLSITEQLHKDAKSMTVIEYHAAMKMLGERAKEMEKMRKKH